MWVRIRGFKFFKLNDKRGNEFLFTKNEAIKALTRAKRPLVEGEICLI